MKDASIIGSARASRTDDHFRDLELRLTGGPAM
jgi:hypothetical protein